MRICVTVDVEVEDMRLAALYALHADLMTVLVQLQQEMTDRVAAMDIELQALRSLDKKGQD